MKSILVVSILLSGWVAIAGPTLPDRTSKAEGELVQLGQSLGVPASLQYKRLETMVEEFPLQDVKNPILEILNLPQVRVSVEEEYTSLNNPAISPYLYLNGQDITKPEEKTNLVIVGRYVIFVNRDLETVAKAFVTTEHKTLPPNWLEIQKKSDQTSGNYRVVQFNALKGGHFAQLCESATHVVRWDEDHVEVQGLDTRCYEVKGKTIAEAEASIAKKKAKGKDPFTWVRQGRQVADLIRVEPNVTAVVVRNVTNVSTHNAALGLVKVDLKRVLNESRSTAGNGIADHLTKMGVKARKESFGEEKEEDKKKDRN